MSSTWTIEDLQALETAIAKGVLIVKYTDKEIRYRSLKEMLELRTIMRRSLGLDGANSGRRLAATSKGFC